MKKVFVVAMASFGYNVLNVDPLKCVSMNNQEGKIRPGMINVNSKEPSFYPCNHEINKCSGSCNNFHNLCAKLSDVGKSINFIVANLVSRTNKAKQIKWHENCKCKCRLDASVCNNEHRWNKDKCSCECK